MMNIILVSALIFFSCFLCGFKKNNLVLWYSQPADNWNEALPLGNGRMGAMVFGGIGSEHLEHNEKTLYSGEPSQNYKNVNITPDFDKVKGMLSE